MKKINRQRIFQLIYKEGPLSKQAITAALNVSTPTVTQNLKELEEQDLILKQGYFASTGGRKAKAITYQPNARFAIGLDVTANHLTTVIINLGIDIIYRRRVRLHFENTQEYFRMAGAMVRQAIKESGIDSNKITGTGIAVPAHVSEDGLNITYAPILDFTGGNIKEFAQFIDYPCRFINDASAACMAEYWNVNELVNIVYLSLSNSVGGAILLNNTVYPGENQRSAEFGHMTLVPGGRPCYCGQKGCVEAYCNARLLSDTCNGDLALFFEMLSMESTPHLKIWNEYLDDLAIAINSLRMMFDCQIVLGGYVGGYIEPYIPDLRQRVSKLNSFGNDGSYLQVCRYKFEASAVGSALQYISEFLEEI
ncbi:MAG: ROK family transcriptional regulator [Eubacteriales bacterium]|nr:ROK family transcriptional regulator [Eubacteriales bacterium]